MNIVQSGLKLNIYNDTVKTFKQLPVGSYEVSFHPQMGFWLSIRPNLQSKEEKIYGKYGQKIEKILKSFSYTDRNLGIILSGTKGMGKTLFVKRMAEQCIEAGYPVIIVDSYIPGIAGFIGSIEQEVVVIFDEFEKNFKTDFEYDDYDNKTAKGGAQDEMLTLFDGLDGGKKLFAITCNDVDDLSSYIKNRPGRFQYHFTLTHPSYDEIEEYLNDKLLDDYKFNIDNLLKLSYKMSMTYDYLRAIAFELNQGYSLQETLEDLNISRAKASYKIMVIDNNNQTFVRYGAYLDLGSDKPFSDTCWESGRENRITVCFKPSDIIFDKNENIMCIPIDKVRISNYYNTEHEKEFIVKKVIVEKIYDDSIYKYVV